MALDCYRTYNVDCDCCGKSAGFNSFSAETRLEAIAKVREEGWTYSSKYGFRCVDCNKMLGRV